MTPMFPVIELVDRYCIAKLKFNKTGKNFNELEFYEQQLSGYDLSLVESNLSELYTIHSNIWELEWQLKSGLEDQLGLEEIGRRAIRIRDWNNKRVALKNVMSDVLGCKVKEIKKDHLSE